MGKCWSVLVFGADLHVLHACLGLRTCLERAVIDHGRRPRGRLGTDGGTQLSGGVADHVRVAQNGGRLSEGRRDERQPGYLRSRTVSFEVLQ